MKSKKIPLGTHVKVLWSDSATYSGWRLNTVGMKPAAVVTVGIVMESNKDSLIVSTSIADNGSYLDPVVVPWVAIEQIEIL